MPRIQTVSVSASPADSLREAERIADILRSSGATVTVGPPHTLTQGRKAGLGGVNLTIYEPGEESPVIEAVVTAAPEIVERPLSLDELKARDAVIIRNVGESNELGAVNEKPKNLEAIEKMSRNAWLRWHPNGDYDAWVAAGRPKGKMTPVVTHSQAVIQ